MPENKFKLLNVSTATGHGVNDMRGGNVVILAALQALEANKLPDDALSRCINLKQYPLLIQRAAVFTYRLTR